MVVLVIGDAQAAPAGALVARRGAEVVLCAAGAEPVGVSADGILVEPPHGWDRRLDAAVIVTRSAALLDVLRPWAEVLARVPILLAPGGVGGALRVAVAFRGWLGSAPPVAETTGFLAGGALIDGLRVDISAAKAGLPVAGVGADDAAQITAALPGLGLVASDLVTTSLSNTNHAIHPPLMLLNADAIRAGTPFLFYRDGLRPGADALFDAIDADRLAVLRALGGDPIPARDWLLRFYAHEGMSGATLSACLAGFAPFGRVAGPSSFDHRYLTDDVPHGIAGWAAVGRLAGTPTPAVDELVAKLSRVAPHLNMRTNGRAAELVVQGGRKW